MSPVLPEQPYARVAAFMAGFPHPWALCGGWAVDSWLGRQTRPHGDVDITVHHEHQAALFEHLAGWNLIAHDPNVAGATTEPWDGRTLDLPAHIHARPSGARNLELLKTWVTSPGGRSSDGEDIELILNEGREGGWLLNRDPAVWLAHEEASRLSAVGLPTFVPELLMFFKATYSWGTPQHPRARDAADFQELIPLLSPLQRSWLRDAISAVGHPWVPLLEG